MSGAEPFSFLFDSSDPRAPSSYGGRFDPAFLTALRACDRLGRVRTWILRGDLQIHHVGSRLQAVENDGSGSAYRYRYDPKTIKTLIYDFSEWVRAAPSQVNVERLQNLLLGARVLHCITASSLEPSLARQIDLKLRVDPLYVGMAAIDLGNPVMVKVLMEFLVRDAGIIDGRLWLEADFEGDVHTLFEGGAEYHPEGVGVSSPRGLAKALGPLPHATGPSDSGVRAAARLHHKTEPSFQRRVLSEFASIWDFEGNGPFHFEALAHQSVLETAVPPPKLTHYALNSEHPDGRGKAKFFNEVLQIGPADWLFLKAQIHDAVLSAELRDFVMKRWSGGIGLSFNAILPIKGMNGRTANVLTNWILEPDKEPSLSTIIPFETKDILPPPAKVAVLPNNLEGDQKWEALYELAHSSGMTAHDRAVPTPMFLVGYGGHSDGECGFAYVHVPDARRDFARWLIKAGKAHRGFKGGATIHCPRDGQSMERAFAYAAGFARVLALNAVPCTTEKRPD